MKQIDKLVGRLVRFAAEALEVASNGPVVVRTTAGERASNQLLDHAAVTSMVQEVCPPPRWRELAAGQVVRFVYEGAAAGVVTVETGYLTEPTPGVPNAGGLAALGPLVEEVLHSPNVPTAVQPLVVTARIRETFAPVGDVTLTYRIQFGAEVAIPMRDDGTQGDGRAGDGIYGAAIPERTARPGQMIRYAVTATDREGHAFRIPLHLDPLNSEEYRGTVVADPTVSSRLPIVHLFAAPSELPRIDGEAGGRVAVFFDGELYDNVRMEVRGNTTAGCNKKSHRVEFPRDHRFRPPGSDLRLRRTSFMADYADPAYLRQHLSFWLATRAGLHAPFYDAVRLQLNGTFYQLAYHSDVLGDEQLRRFGLDPDGALYKAVGVAIPDGSSTGGFQKLTRTGEGTEDYVEFVNAIGPGRPLADRRTALFDRVDLPPVINYMAVARIVQEEDDIWANMTLYRDTRGDGEWRIIPFDMNLSWGQIYGSGTVQATSDSFKSHPLYGNSRNVQAGGPFDAYNRFYDAIMQVPETRAMLLRRMRTLMDRFIQPPGTLPATGILENHIHSMTNTFWAEAFLDRARWGWPVGCGPYGFGANLWLTNGVHALQNQFITPRRRHLFATHSITNTARTVGLANSQRAGIPLPQEAGVAIQFGELDANPASRNQDEEYFQVVNPNDVAVDLSGWTVSGAVEFTFVGGTVLPPESTLYLSPSPAAFRARASGPAGGQRLFVHGPYRGQLSARGETLTLHDDAGRLVATRSYPGNPSPAQGHLRITELHYHPSSAGAADDDEALEFVELENTGTTPLDLAGVRFVDGIAADLGTLANSLLPPGETLVLAADPVAFVARHGLGRRVVGPFTGRLDNAGERLRLVDAANEEIEDFQYDPDWFPSTDGAGPSLERLEVDQPAGSKASWRASRTAGGSPGAGGGVRPRI
ncbi:MAG: CotH kinase family protein, partial [Verrucomicrobia bacterium]|nr:CotH kinase family protein [Verrucomicrobiota bacterium]